jgi:RNA polymerase sigma factor (sigma-70 family)
MTPPPAEQFAARIFIGPVLRAQPDRRLVDLVRDGYDGAFEEIVRRYRRQLDRFAAGIVGGRSEDVTQDAFSKALPALRRSEVEIELRPWLYRIVRNTALNDLRDRAPVAEELPETLPGARSAAAEAEGREELRELMARLQALPEPQRAALVMRELEGLSHEEIAAALGVSGGAARQAIFRARAALREGLGLLMPLPALRVFAEHGAEMVKAGAATALIAGTVGAGVAIEHHGRGARDSGIAEAAPLVVPNPGAAPGSGESRSGATASSASARPDGDHESGAGDRSDGMDGRNSGPGGSLGDGDRSASSGPGGSGGSNSGPSDGSGDDSGHSGSGGSNSGSGDSGSRLGSGSGERQGSDSGDDGVDDGSHSGSGSGDDGGGTSGGSGSGDGFSNDEGGDSSGPGGGEVVSEPVPSPDPAVSEGTESSESGSDEGGTSGSGSGDLTSGASGETGDLDVSP